VQYNAQLFAILAEKLLLENGVDILYGSYVVDVSTENNRITKLYVENKSGRTAYFVDAVVDATGDCDIAHFAGVPTAFFEQGNVLAAWYYYTNPSGYHLQMLGASDIPKAEQNGTAQKPLVNRRFSGLDGKELSEQVCMQHNAMYENLMKRRENDPTLVPVTIATIPQIRMTRRIAGEYELGYDEQHTYMADSIGMVSNWKKRGPIYEVPFRTLYNSSMKNLIVAGRCTSVNEALWDVMRVIPCCAVTGQAAGTAAALSDDFSKLDVKKLQTQLRRDGVKLHQTDL
jgi:hypothetical protein